ncbi:hypothetical protein [Cystobacter fuscus]|uniref:hypothetical protein n=1 Tax=Cystobacter fuscus TaxID=43 RepID=UPI0012DE9FA0|nr:hypothetical protein [Cystobacter fuscus]
MKISRLFVFALLMLPLMGADCGEGEDETPGVVTPTEPKCSPKNCEDGCCLADVCYRVQSREVCGSFGADCAMCKPLESCQKDASSDWVCLADPARNWSVQPQSASVPLLDPLDGESWDADGSAPDVVIELGCPMAGVVVNRRTSESVSYMPTWVDGACVTTAAELLKTPVSINVIDVDAFFDDPIFTTSYSFKEADFVNGSVEIPISSDGVSKLKLRLTQAQ